MSDLFNRATKLRWRRRIRKSRRQVEDLSIQAEEQLDQHLFRRLGRLAFVRRFVTAWMLLFVMAIGGLIYQYTALSKYYQQLAPVPGGTYIEGVIGTFTNANPIFASSPVDNAVAELLFEGLLKYDERGELTNALAESWSVDKDETTYTVKLRPNLLWQNGTPLTAEDVVFTYQTIQNPDVKSPLIGSWKGVEVSAVDTLTVQLKLPNVFAAFPYSMTVGILPKQLLADTPPQQLRSLRFNTTEPIGAGPFAWDTIEISGDTPETREQQISLIPNEHYYAGKPKLQKFHIHSFLDEGTMVSSFKKGELTGMSGLNSIPEELNTANIFQYDVTLSSAVGVFLRTSQDYLKEVKVRQALVQAVDVKQILSTIGYPVIAVNQPFLKSQFAYDASFAQPSYDVAAANTLLDQAGWIRGEGGLRYKDGKQLTFKLYSQMTSEYAYITQQLQNYWRAVGVNAEVFLQTDTDFQDVVNKHYYDALLYGISLGADPDVFAYWHSSQAGVLSENRFNFSEYQSNVADKGLEAGRTRIDAALRKVKYKPFLSAWKTDVPALMLYQPRYVYISNVDIDGFDADIMHAASDRYANVANWMIRRAKVTN